MTGSTGPADTRARGEFAAAVAPALRAVAGRRAELVIGLGALVTVLAVLALAGGVVHDRAIDARRGVAVAEVLDGSSFARTLVRFTAPDGATVVPERGVFYPSGLARGTTVLVEYDRADPEVVRVAGRGAVGQSLPLLAGVAGTWLVLGPLALWLRRRRRAGAARGAAAGAA